MYRDSERRLNCAHTLKDTCKCTELNTYLKNIHNISTCMFLYLFLFTLSTVSIRKFLNVLEVLFKYSMKPAADTKSTNILPPSVILLKAGLKPLVCCSI